VKHYDDGYKAGRNWKNNWIPGGPYVCDKETEKENRVWKEGFFDGLEINRYKNTKNIQELLNSKEGA